MIQRVIITLLMAHDSQWLPLDRNVISKSELHWVLCRFTYHNMYTGNTAYKISKMGADLRNGAPNSYWVNRVAGLSGWRDYWCSLYLHQYSASAMIRRLLSIEYKMSFNNISLKSVARCFKLKMPANTIVSVPWSPSTTWTSPSSSKTSSPTNSAPNTI